MKLFSNKTSSGKKEEMHKAQSDLSEEYYGKLRKTSNNIPLTLERLGPNKEYSNLVIGSRSFQFPHLPAISFSLDKGKLKVSLSSHPFNKEKDILNFQETMKDIAKNFKVLEEFYKKQEDTWAIRTR